MTAGPQSHKGWPDGTAVDSRWRTRRLQESTVASGEDRLLAPPSQAVSPTSLSPCRTLACSRARCGIRSDGTVCDSPRSELTTAFEMRK